MIVSDAVPVPPAFVAPMVTVVLPVWLGVPLITPVELLSDRPVGSVPVTTL